MKQSRRVIDRQRRTEKVGVLQNVHQMHLRKGKTATDILVHNTKPSARAPNMLGANVIVPQAAASMGLSPKIHLILS